MQFVVTAPLNNMANYNLDWTDEDLKLDIVVNEETIDSTSTSLNLDGEGVLLWGEGLNEDWLKLLEHFNSGNIEPNEPTIGQLWFNSASNSLSVWVESSVPQSRLQILGYSLVSTVAVAMPPLFIPDRSIDSGGYGTMTGETVEQPYNIVTETYAISVWEINGVLGENACRSIDSIAPELNPVKIADLSNGTISYCDNPININNGDTFGPGGIYAKIPRQGYIYHLPDQISFFQYIKFWSTMRYYRQVVNIPLGLQSTYGFIGQMFYEDLIHNNEVTVGFNYPILSTLISDYYQTPALCSYVYYERWDNIGGTFLTGQTSGIPTENYITSLNFKRWHPPSDPDPFIKTFSGSITPPIAVSNKFSETIALGDPFYNSYEDSRAGAGTSSLEWEY